MENIYSKDELLSASQIKTLAYYYKTYQKFVRICIALQAIFVSHINFDDLDEELDPELKEFIQPNCDNPTLEKIQKDIENIEIQSIMKNTSYKIPGFNLKLYGFVYDKLPEFPESDIAYDTITTNSFFKNVHRILKVKMHLHHSHVTVQILDYIHDFCNLRVCCVCT